MSELNISQNSAVKDKQRLIVFCSVQPHKIPPPFYSRLAAALAAHNPTVLIDMPSVENLGRMREIGRTYTNMLRWLVNPRGLLIWKPGPFAPRVHYWLLMKFITWWKYLHHLKVILYTTSPLNDPVYAKTPADFSMYDCYDNPDRQLQVNKPVLAGYNAVGANSRMLYKFLKRINPQCYMVSAGFHDYQTPRFNKQKIENTVMFFGGISHRINYEWIEAAVTKLPKVRFFFIGEKYLNKYYRDINDDTCEKQWQKIVTQANVSWWEKNITPEAAVKIMAMFSVGIIPYDIRDSYNYNSHPIKLYDYLASGLPVVSSAIPSMLEYKSRLPIYFARNTAEFVAGVKKLATSPRPLDRQSQREIQKVLNKHSLDTKLRQLNRIFGEK